ncbi:MAG: DNA alkylation repair protein [Spirochaetales bacterium]|jgi:3-methyladenine DNA glycosylase AlkD|nr:DNA alkylation repair protein [Spirochaetales bacterium]
MTSNYKRLIKKHQQALEAQAIEKTKLWWEKYMKGVIPFRGVGIPKNRELLIDWRNSNGIDKWSLEEQLELALAFIKEPIAEDKLAGILFIQNFLLSKLPWEVLVEKYDDLYKNEFIFDWNICDWFCVRVLGATIKINGEQCAKAIANWKDAHYLWQARSSLVPFVNLVSEPYYYPYIHESCSVLIEREERFSKTAVGWILREISKHDEQFAISFVDNHLLSFSKESLGNALKYFEKDKKNEYLQVIRKAKQGTAKAE